MQKNIRKISLIIILVLITNIPCFAQENSIANLIEYAKEMDDQAITLKGEVIGDVMFRKDMAWINVSDGTGVIGIWIEADEARKVNIEGDYKHQGDIIEVNGIFHRAYKEQGGEMAIQGESLKISLSGYSKTYAIQNTRLIILSILVILSVLIYLLRIKRLKRKIINYAKSRYK